MCGIVGIVGLKSPEPVDEARLKLMRDVLRHRGPDGEGLWRGRTSCSSATTAIASRSGTSGSAVPTGASCPRACAA